MGMNLYGHIAEHYDSQWGYDPGSLPTYPPTIVCGKVGGNFSWGALKNLGAKWYLDGVVIKFVGAYLMPSVRHAA